MAREINFLPKGSEFDRDMREFGAVVGTILLQNFVPTFDYRKLVVILEQVALRNFKPDAP